MGESPNRFFPTRMADLEWVAPAYMDFPRSDAYSHSGSLCRLAKPFLGAMICHVSYFNVFWFKPTSRPPKILPMLETLKRSRERKPSPVLAIFVLGFTLTAPCMLGQDADPTAEIRRFADDGNASAQATLGFMYEIGQGVAQDEAEAVRWYRLAADQGEVVAQINLGLMYADGRGVPEDDAEAVKWLQLAAEQGEVVAQFNLGLMYDNGRGVPENDAEAARWYLLAAEQGDAAAQATLGLMYADGRSMVRDEAEAVRWFQLAADQGHSAAQFNLGLLYDNGRGVPENDAEAVTWYLLAAEQGDAPPNPTSASCTPTGVVCR